MVQIWYKMVQIWYKYGPLLQGSFHPRMVLRQATLMEDARYSASHSAGKVPTRRRRQDLAQCPRLFLMGFN
jgi:hypothetical protein